MPLHVRDVNVENDGLHGLVRAKTHDDNSSSKTIWMVPKI
jgi:hypothetical protein